MFKWFWTISSLGAPKRQCKEILIKRSWTNCMPLRWDAFGNYLAWHLIQRSHHLRCNQRQNQASHRVLWWYLNHGKESQVKVVWACIKIIRACQHDFTRNSARREKKRPTKEALGKQHRWMDRVEVLPRRKRSWKQNKMEGEGCNVCGAPTVIDYGIGLCLGL